VEEEEAKRWLAEQCNVSRETFERIERFIALLREENERQNLVSAGTLDQIWTRHVVDSIQLLRHAPDHGTWADLGSGAGFPGLLVALLHAGPVTLIDQRRLRVDFLGQAAAVLGVRPTIICANARRVEAPPFAVISARAVAPLGEIFALGAHLATNDTRWVLPKGRNAKSELDAARASWQGVFRLEPSVTDPEARIVVAEQVRPRSKGKSRT
jgi:16S rRNA (guanine527-N7)-methyltransferase